MRKRFLVATLAGALLLFGAPQGALAHAGGYDRGCRYDDPCSDRGSDRGGYDSSGDDQKWWDCRSDPYRDNDRYGTPCRYYEECTNYPRCKD